MFLVVKNASRSTHMHDVNERREIDRRKQGWPLWAKVAAIATAGLAVGTLVKSASASNPIYTDPIMCVQNEGAVSTTPCVPKNMLNFFNDYFPNVVVVGADSKVGQETVKWLDHLGISHRAENGYDRTKIPFEVWSHVDEDSVNRALQDRVIDAWKKNIPLTGDETQALDRMKGMAACYFANQLPILDTIKRYDEAVEKLDALKNEPDSPEKRALKAEVERYKTIFIFEHNARFGTVRDDGSADLSQETAKGIEKVFKALPDDWEVFNLFVAEAEKGLDNSSDRFPGVKSLVPDSVLLHPGDGRGAKAYALSYKIYPALKRLFSQVTEKVATRTFRGNDLEIQRLSVERAKEGGLLQLAPVDDYIYRKASPSFHDTDKRGYSTRNYPSAQYRKIMNTNTVGT